MSRQRCENYDVKREIVHFFSQNVERCCMWSEGAFFHKFDLFVLLYNKSLESQCFPQSCLRKHWDSQETKFTVPLRTSHWVLIVFLTTTEKWANCVQNSQLCWICWCCVRDEASKLRKLVYIWCFFFNIYYRDIWLIENSVFWRQLSQRKFSLSLWGYHFRMPLILPF